jgi:hypothetical protein
VVEGGGELGVAVADQQLEPADLLTHLHQQFAGLLRDRGPVGFVVIPASHTRRRSSSMTNRT